MKALIMVGYSNEALGVEVTQESGALLAGLATATKYGREYVDGKYVWRPAGTVEEKDVVKVEFVPDENFTEATPAVDAMAKAVKAAESRWLEHYNRAEKLEKELNELKEKLKGLQPAAEEQE